MDTSIFGTIKQIFKNITMILSWTIFSLLILIIGFLVYYLVSANIYASKGEKYEPKFSLYTIVSPSMEPNIKVYDVILNTRIDDPSKIKVGDVITFISTSNISNGMTVTHRVTKIVQGPEGLEFKTKGDNNLSEDTDTAKANNVLGKVALKIPQLGRLQFFLSSKGGWLIVIVCPALFIIVNDIFKILKLNKTKKTIIDSETEEIDSEKIELESFRKEEIKEKLNRKELKKQKKEIKSEDEIKDSIEETSLVDTTEKVRKNKENKINNHEENIKLITATEIELIEPQGKHEIVSIDNDKKNSKKKKNKKPKEIDKKYNIFGEEKKEYNIFSEDYESKKEIMDNDKINEKDELVEGKENNQYNVNLPKMKNKK